MKRWFFQAAAWITISTTTLHFNETSAHDLRLPTGESSLAHTLTAWDAVTRAPQDRIERLPANQTCTERLDAFAVPAIGRETSHFGVRKDPLGGGWRLHAGIDLAAPMGSLVPSAAGGAVLRSGWSKGYGNMVIIDHGDGWTTRYAHLSRSLVRVGQDVDGGQAIGLVGATGHATGSHLHFEIRQGNRALDPERAEAFAAVSCEYQPALAPVLREVPAQSGWERTASGGLPTAVIR